MSAYQKTSSSTQKNPSKRPRMEPLVVNGFDTPPNRFPWYTTLYVQTDRGLFLCGGALIDPHWVLSAAHCIRPGTVDLVLLIGQYFTDFEFQNKTMPGSIEKKKPANILMHPGWDFETFQYDFMMIRLEEPSTLPLVKLDNGTIGELLKPRDPLAVMGLGTQSNTGGADLPVVLQEANVEYVPNNVCAEAWDDYINITDVMTCNIGDGNTCYGDSGGPLIVEKNDTFPDDVLFGIVSFGKGQQCVSPSPNVAGRVSSAYPWIMDVIDTWKVIMSEREAVKTNVPSPLPDNDSIPVPVSASLVKSVSANVVPDDIKETTSSPTIIPTFIPTIFPTNNPTELPTGTPTNKPTLRPTRNPTSQPTSLPTSLPTNVPTNQPTLIPTSYLIEQYDYVPIASSTIPVITTWEKPSQISLKVTSFKSTISLTKTVKTTNMNEMEVITTQKVKKQGKKKGSNNNKNNKKSEKNGKKKKNKTLNKEKIKIKYIDNNDYNNINNENVFFDDTSTVVTAAATATTTEKLDFKVKDKKKNKKNINNESNNNNKSNEGTMSVAADVFSSLLFNNNNR